MSEKEALRPSMVRAVAGRAGYRARCLSRSRTTCGFRERLWPARATFCTARSRIRFHHRGRLCQQPPGCCDRLPGRRHYRVKPVIECASARSESVHSGSRRTSGSTAFGVSQPLALREALASDARRYTRQARAGDLISRSAVSAEAAGARLGSPLRPDRRRFGASDLEAGQSRGVERRATAKRRLVGPPASHTAQLSSSRLFVWQR